MDKVILLCLLLASCSMEHHLTKAVNKGYAPEKERVEVERIELVHIHDTITNELIRVDTIRTRETRTVYQDRPLTRQERNVIELELRTELNRDKAKYRKEENIAKNDLKIEKERTEQLELKMHALIKAKKIEFTRRSYWYVWLLIGLGMGVFRKNIWSIVRKLVLKV
jgi:hypothetical protein